MKVRLVVKLGRACAVEEVDVTEASTDQELDELVEAFVINNIDSYWEKL